MTGFVLAFVLGLVIGSIVICSDNRQFDEDEWN